MEINFKNNNAKYERISELMQSVGNRLNKINKLEKSIDNDFNQIIRKNQSSTSELSDKIINGLMDKSFVINAKVLSHKKTVKQLAQLVSKTKEMISDDQNSFSEHYSNDNDLNDNNSEFNKWINEGDHRVVNDAMTNKLLEFKVSHKFIEPLGQRTIRKIVQLNSESIHINNAVAEIKRLQQELISDYRQERRDVIVKGMIIEQINKAAQLVGDQTTVFNPAQESSSVLGALVGSQHNTSVPIASYHCLGRTGFCGVTH
ncbi:hypothetical protein ABN063_18860 [Providencia vermicola]|uniref:hypothetical protein n=1 Tax=Providencia vermicola TaxID=333965 RepID=UPI0032DABBBC